MPEKEQSAIGEGLKKGRRQRWRTRYRQGTSTAREVKRDISIPEREGAAASAVLTTSAKSIRIAYVNILCFAHLLRRMHE